MFMFYSDIRILFWQFFCAAFFIFLRISLVFAVLRYPNVKIFRRAPRAGGGRGALFAVQNIKFMFMFYSDIRYYFDSSCRALWRPAEVLRGSVWALLGAQNIKFMFMFYSDIRIFQSDIRILFSTFVPTETGIHGNRKRRT